MSIPKACLTYNETHTFTVSENIINSISTQKFCTHLSEIAENLHAFSQLLFIPGCKCLQALAVIIEPQAGEKKDDVFWGIANRVASFAVLVLCAPAALILSPFAFLLRCIDHTYRPALSLLQTPLTSKYQPSHLNLTKKEPLHIRTHNLGFVSTSMSTIGDLRHPMERVVEVVEGIIGDAHQPDIIFFQETFHEDAAKALATGIKSAYPNIVHSVAPQVGGFNSGTMIASKYPIKEIKFQRFGYFLGFENLFPRGITRVTLETANGDEIFLYGVHTQAFLGKERAKSREKQLEQIQAFMQTDRNKNPQALQILVGDFNTSRVTDWGEDNFTTEQPEKKVLEKFNEIFHDLFLNSHDEVTGLRKVNRPPRYLKYDNTRLGQNNLLEPSGSWYHGPFAKIETLLKVKEAYEQWKHGLVKPKMAEGITIYPSTWGMKEWQKYQIANTARYDYICVPKEQKDSIMGEVEIRRAFVRRGSPSASTDHLPVDAKIWKEKLNDV